MKVAIEQDGAFRLEAETSEDFKFIGECDMHRQARVSKVQHLVPPPSMSNVASIRFSGLVPDASSQLNSALAQLFRLGLAHTTLNRHVGALAADPETQEKLATLFKQLKLVTDALGEIVCQGEFVGQEMHSAHSGSSENEADSVSQGGAA